MSVSTGGSVTIISCTCPLHWGCNPLTSSGDYYCQCGKTVCYQWLLSKLLYICIHLLLNYTQNVGSPYTCPNTERSFQARNKSNSDCYNRLYMFQQTVHVHTLYLLWGADASKLKVFHSTEPQEQPRQHIHWNMPQSNMLNTSVNVCRHWVGKQE